MKRIIFSVIAVFFCTASFAQYTCYAAARSGLSMREQPNTGAKVLEKITYGEKLVTVAGDANQPAINTEGFTGFWWKVNYNNKTGYIVSSYVLPVPPPKTGTKTLNDYFAQLSSTLGDPLIIRTVDSSLNEMGESVLTKHFYKNGMESHRREGYEYASELSLLPGFGIQECFLLLRLLGQYPELVGDKDTFPSKNAAVKNAIGEKTTEIEWEKYGFKPEPVKRVKIISTQGAITEVEIFLLDNQGVIFWSGGV